MSVSGLKFFFGTTLDRPELIRKLRHQPQPQKTPEILSVEEVTRIIQCAGDLRYQAALSVAYGVELRASEITHLKVADVDRERMVLRLSSFRTATQSGQRRSRVTPLDADGNNFASKATSVRSGGKGHPNPAASLRLTESVVAGRLMPQHNAIWRILIPLAFGRSTSFIFLTDNLLAGILIPHNNVKTQNSWVIPRYSAPFSP